MDPTSQDDNTSKDRWSLCPSRSLPGKFYYFNLSSGESYWASQDENKLNIKETIITGSKTVRNHEPHSPEHEPENSIQTDNSKKNNFEQLKTTHPDLMPFYDTQTPLIVPNNNMWSIHLPCNTSQPIILTQKIQNSQMIAIAKSPISVEATFIPLTQRFNKKFGIKRVISYGANNNVTKSVQTEEFEPSMKRKLASEFFERKRTKSESVQTNIDDKEFSEKKTTEDKAIICNLDNYHDQDKSNNDMTEAQINHKSKELNQVKDISENNVIIVPEKGILKLSKNDLRLKLITKKVNESGDLGGNSKIEDVPKKRVTFKLDCDNEIISEGTGPKPSASEPSDTYNKSSYSTYKVLELAKPGMTTDPWYIVVDGAALIEEFDFIDDVVQSDKQCCVMLPYTVNAKLQSLSKGESLMRPQTMVTRQILRHIAKCANYLVQNESNSEINEINDIINCGMNILEAGHHAILLTNDVELKLNAESGGIHCYSVQELKTYVKHTKPVTFELKKNIRITVASSDIQDGNELLNNNLTKFIPIDNINKVDYALQGSEVHPSLYIDKFNQCKVVDAQTSPIIFDKAVMEQNVSYPIDINTVNEVPKLPATIKNKIKLIRKPPKTVIPIQEQIHLKHTEEMAKETPKSPEEPFGTIEKPSRNMPEISQNSSKYPTEIIKKPFRNLTEILNIDLSEISSLDDFIEILSDNSNFSKDIPKKLETSPSLLENAPISIFLKTEIDEKINAFCVKNIDLVQNCEIWREDFLSIFVQITVDLLNKILQCKSHWTGKELRLRESIEKLKTYYKNDTRISYVANKLSDLVRKYSDDNTGIINSNAAKNDFIKLIGCGDLLIKYLKDDDRVRPFVCNAEESMAYLLDRTPKNSSPTKKSSTNYSNIYQQSNHLNQSNAATNDAAQIGVFGNNYQTQTTVKEVHIIRTIGRDLNKFTFNSKNRLETFNESAILAENPPLSHDISLNDHDSNISDYTNYCQELLLTDLALSEASSESLPFIKRDFVDNDDAITMHDEGIYSREESTPDSGVFSDKSEQYSIVILAFLSELSKVFVIIKEAVNKIKLEIKNGDFSKDCRQRGHQKMRRADKYLTKLIAALQSILTKEEADTDETVTAVFKNIETQDIRLSRYRKVITKCLEQANILRVGVVRSLNLTSDKPDLSLMNDLELKNDFYNMFEN